MKLERMRLTALMEREERRFAREHPKSRELFERLLRDEEKHVDWLEAQVHQIEEIGYERYLSQQIGKE